MAVNYDQGQLPAIKKERKSEDSIKQLKDGDKLFENSDKDRQSDEPNMVQQQNQIEMMPNVERQGLSHDYHNKPQRND